MSHPPDRGWGRGRGRGKRPIHAEIEAYLKANRLQYPSLQEAGSSSMTPSMKEVVLTEEVYRLNKTFENMIILESQDEVFDPWEIKSQYLDVQNYPVPDGKPRYVYEAMLSESGSVAFHHTYEGKPGKLSSLSYSKAIIKMVIPIGKWGHHPHRSRILSIKTEDNTLIHYNYWDYMEAWTKAFYYQNSRRKHTWFLKLCQNLNGKTEVPNWFYYWWSKLGPQVGCIPHEVLDKTDFLIKNHPRLKNLSISDAKACFFFFQNFGIPWIWRWDLQIGKDNLGLPVLQRTFYYKWWNGIDLSKTFIEIDTLKQELKLQIQQPEQPSKKNPFLDISAQIKSKDPSLSDQEIIIKTMDFFKEQFLQTVQASSMADDESMTSAKSNEEIDQNNPFTCLAGESQDPFDDDGATPTLDDYWDSMTEVMTEQLSQRKGKGQVIISKVVCRRISRLLNYGEASFPFYCSQ